MSIYDLAVAKPNGDIQPMSEYKDKVVLIVNTASKCGFTPQYEGLEELHKEFGEDGLVILGFPCNQFNGQEPGNAEEIQNFCSLTYDVTFPLMAKVEVNGNGADPLWKYLKKQQSGLLGMSSIKWNFTKFIVDKTGNVVSRHGPAVKPELLKKDIQELL